MTGPEVEKVEHQGTFSRERSWKRRWAGDKANISAHDSVQLPWPCGTWSSGEPLDNLASHFHATAEIQ